MYILLLQMIIFRYVEDKDVFQRFYSKMLAKRLVQANSASDDAEVCETIILVWMWIRHACTCMCRPYSQKYWQKIKFGSLTVDACTAKLNSANISVCLVWSRTTKLNDRQYFLSIRYVVYLLLYIIHDRAVFKAIWVGTIPGNPSVGHMTNVARCTLSQVPAILILKLKKWHALNVCQYRYVYALCICSVHLLMSISLIDEMWCALLAVVILMIEWRLQ